MGAAGEVQKKKKKKLHPGRRRPSEGRQDVVRLRCYQLGRTRTSSQAGRGGQTPTTRGRTGAVTGVSIRNAAANAAKVISGMETTVRARVRKVALFSIFLNLEILFRENFDCKECFFLCCGFFYVTPA